MIALACVSRRGDAIDVFFCGETLMRRLESHPDEYLVYALEGEVLSITLSPDVRVPGFVPRWRLLDQSRRAVHLSDGGRRCVGRCETDPLPESGVFTLSVSDPGRGRGEYTVTLEAVSATSNGESNGPPAPTCARTVSGVPDGTQPLAIGERTSGTIQVRGETDTFTFVADAGAVLRIALQPLVPSATFDPRWELFRPDGTRLPTHDGTRECHDTCDTDPLPEGGVFTLLVSEGSNDDVGGYTLGIESVDPTATTTTTTTTTSAAPDTTTTTTEGPSTTTSTVTTTSLVEEPTTTTTLALYELDDVVAPEPATASVPDRLGSALVSDGQRLLIGSPYDDTAAPAAGAVLIVDVAGQPGDPTFGRLARTLAKPGLPATADGFGAALALVGAGVVVGAPGDGGTGSAFVYATFDDAAPRTLVPPTPEAGARFASALAANGDVLVVGAPGVVRDGVVRAGRAFLFAASSGAWLGTLERPDAPAVDDQFGFAVAIADDRVLVGAPGTTDRPGRAFLFSASTGMLLATLESPAPAPGDAFGAAVAFADGVPVVGAPGADGGAGAVAAFADGGALGVGRPRSAPGDRFGSTLVASDVGLLVGTPGDSAEVPGGGAVYRFIIADPEEPEEEIRKPGPLPNDNFGSAVTAVGGRVFVGAPGDDSGTPDGGAVFLFDGPVLDAVFRKRLDLGAFGTATAAVDGDLAVGSPGTGTAAGTVSVVDRDTGGPGVTIRNPGDSGARFGYAVASLGQELVIGAPFEPGEVGPRVGAVYVFTRAGTWRLTLTPPTPTPGDQFGFAVGTLPDAVLVGAPLTGERDTGVVHLFDGATGALRVTFRKPIPATGDFFGAAVAGDGDDVLVGAPFDGTSGAAYLFRRDTAALTATLRGPAVGTTTLFGASVALGGRWLVAGAPMADGPLPQSGVVYVFDRATGTPLRTIANPTPDTGDEFGAAVALMGDRVLVGAPLDDGGAVDTGTAYVFDAATGALLQTLRNPPQAAFDHFGFSVAAAPTGLLVGSPGPSRVYLFDLISPAAPAAARAAAPRAPAADAVPRCGNGLVEADEVCDDGNDVDTDDCRSDCTRGLCCALDPRAQSRCDDGNPCTDDVLDPVAGCRNVPNGRCCQSDADCESGECRFCVGCFLYDWDCCDRGSQCLPVSAACTGRTCMEAAFCLCEGKLACAGETVPDAVTTLFAQACDQLRLEVSLAPDGTPAGKAELELARGRTRTARQLLRNTARSARRTAAHAEVSKACRRSLLEQVRVVKRAIPKGRRLRRCVLTAP